MIDSDNRVTPTWSPLSIPFMSMVNIQLSVYPKFTPLSITNLCEDVFPSEHTHIKTFAFVTCCCFDSTCSEPVCRPLSCGWFRGTSMLLHGNPQVEWKNLLSYQQSQEIRPLRETKEWDLEFPLYFLSWLLWTRFLTKKTDANTFISSAARLHVYHLLSWELLSNLFHCIEWQFCGS